MDTIMEGLDTSRKLQALMATRDITQQQLADLLDCTAETIRNRMESGKWSIPDIKKVALTYKIDAKDLI